MRNSKRQTKDRFIVTAVIIYLLFAFRLWPLILAFLFIKIVMLITRKFSHREERQEDFLDEEPMIDAIDDQDLWEKKYEFASEQISCLVENEYPNARWAWESACWRDAMQKNEDVYIRLNKEGGYKRAKITLQEGLVSGMEILPDEKNEPAVNTTQQQEVPKKKKDDSGRIAFEWVETHLLDLNARCNEIIGQGESELIVSVSELPEEKCWEAICKELKKEGLENIEILPGEGIKILLN